MPRRTVAKGYTSRAIVTTAFPKRLVSFAAVAVILRQILPPWVCILPPPPPPQKPAARAPAPPPKPDLLVPAIIVGICLVLAPVVWIVGSKLIGGSTAVIGGDAGSAVDSSARIDLEILRQQVEDLQNRLDVAELIS